MAQKVEDLDIDSIIAPEGKKHIVLGSRQCSGLQLVVKGTGRKEWRLRYAKPFSGRRSSFTFGEYPEVGFDDAKREVKRLKADLEKGLEPQTNYELNRIKKTQETVRVAKLVGGRYSLMNLATEFLDYCDVQGNPSKATRKKYRTGLVHHLLPSMAAWDLRYFSLPDYKELIFALAKTSPAAANNAHASLRRLFSWAMEKEFLQYNPIAGQKDILKRVAVEPRERFLSPHELHKFLNELHLQPVNDDTKLALLIQVHTGLRIGEICAFEWDKINFRGRLIAHPKTVMKNGKRATTVLSDAVFRMLAERRKEGQNDSRNRVFAEGFDTNSVISQMRNIKGWIDFGTHDLRRTVSTYLQEFGCPVDVREKITNHAEPKGVRRSYDHAKGHKQQLTWLNLLAAKLAEVKESPSAVDMGIDLTDEDPLMQEYSKYI